MDKTNLVARTSKVIFADRHETNAIAQFSATLIELDGRPCALVIVRDTTARKQAEDALRDSEERFRTLVRDFHVGVVLLGPEAKIQFANQVVQQSFGISLEEAKGRNTSQLDLI